jgi:ML domain
MFKLLTLGFLPTLLATYRNCGSSSDLAKNLVISIVPDAAKAGQDVTTTFDYDLDTVITGGTATYGFSFNGIPFSPTVNDLCVEQAGGCCPDPCPLGIGHHSDKSITTFPSVSRKIITTIKWADQDGSQILCVEWTVKA